MLSLKYLFKNSAHYAHYIDRVVSTNSHVSYYLHRIFYRHNGAQQKKMPFSVYVTRKINEEAKEILEERCDIKEWTGTDPVPRDVLIKEIEGKDALFCTLTEKIDEEILNAGTKLKVIGTMSVGFDHLDLKAIQKRGIKVGHTPDILTDATAELTIALLLATSRKIFEANKAARNGEWKAWSPFWMCGMGLKDSTVGIVGFGRIGQQVAKIIKAFNVKEIIFTNKTRKEKQASEIGATQVNFEELLTESDFVIATCALTPETQGMFDSKAFERMKRTAIFVNTSRGGVVKQDDLCEALVKKQILAAGLDVMTPEPLPTDHKLFTLDNCVVLPHIASATIQTRKAMAILTAKNIVAGLDNKTMPAELTIT